MINIDSNKEGEIVVIKVAGEVDASSSIQLDEEMSKAAVPDAKIVVDLSELEYISSAGLGVFMSYISDLEANKIKFVLYGLKDKVFQVFQILGLDQLLTIANNKEEAIREASAV